jgi:large subunit ribosomal protein L21
MAGAQSCIPNFPATGRLALRVVCGEVKIGEKLMKYAIIESGGKQYKAIEGASIEVDLLEVEDGQQLELNQVLLVVDGENVSVGTPTVAGAHINATVENMVKGPKIVVFKYRAKKHYRVKTGHRQKYTRLKIESIELE